MSLKNGILARNVLWIGPEVQEAIAGARLAIVGCGGLGVLLAVNAAHVGFRRFILCDPDLLDTSNLNRYVIASKDDVGKPKVELIRAYLLRHFPESEVKCIAECFPNVQLAVACSSVTFLVGCLDNVLSRLELDVFARAQGKTLIDLGSGFVVDDTAGVSGKVLGAGGQILFSRGHGACLRCLGFDLDGVKNGYFVPENTPDPSSLLLNSVVASIAVECLLNELTGDLLPINCVSYDRSNFLVVKSSYSGNDDCQICGSSAPPHLKSVMGGHELRAAVAARGILCKTV